MTSIKSEKNALRCAITQWYRASVGPLSEQAWRTVEAAILGLDNAAYDRAYKEAYDRACTGGSSIRLNMEIINARTESLRLKQELETVRYLRIRAAKDHDELQRQFDERGRERDQLTAQRDRHLLERDLARAERDRLKQDLEFTEHRREQAETEIERLRGQLQTQVPALRQLRDEAEAERDGFRGELELLAERTSEEIERLQAELADVCDRGYQDEAERIRLRKALETLADRYHAKFCVRKPSHTRQECERKTYGVQQAEKALAGESVDASGGHVTGGRVFSETDRKPEPEIEAVLMGSQIKCACGCGVTVRRGYCAYRFVKDVLAEATLFVSPEHARKAARPEARTHPPYAAYTDEMRREERDCRS